MRLRNERIYFLFFLLFVAYILCGSHHVTVVFPSWVRLFLFQPQLQGGPDLISSATVAIAR